MTGSPDLERRYSRLLAWYPAEFRREHQAEMLGVLMDSARDGQQRVRLPDAANLIRGALTMRLRVPQPDRGGTPMHPPDENTAPQRSILAKLLVRRWEYRHPRVLLGLRIGAGVITLAFAILLLPYTWWGLLPLAAAAAAFVGGPYIFNVTQSQPAA